jgi:hypothetical protein
MEVAKHHPDIIGLPREIRMSEIENRLTQGVFGCRSTEAVEAAITYAQYLSSVGITPENYPVFLRMLEIENHWVIDALIGGRDPFLLLSGVQPNKYIVGRILAMMTRWHKGGIYPRTSRSSSECCSRSTARPGTAIASTRSPSPMPMPSASIWTRRRGRTIR